MLIVKLSKTPRMPRVETNRKTRLATLVPSRSSAAGNHKTRGPTRPDLEKLVLSPTKTCLCIPGILAVTKKQTENKHTQDRVAQTAWKKWTLFL